MTYRTILEAGFIKIKKKTKETASIYDIRRKSKPRIY